MSNDHYERQRKYWLADRSRWADRQLVKMLERERRENEWHPDWFVALIVAVALGMLLTGCGTTYYVNPATGAEVREMGPYSPMTTNPDYAACFAQSRAAVRTCGINCLDAEEACMVSKGYRQVRR